jgi:hypothetical protein
LTPVPTARLVAAAGPAPCRAYRLGLISAEQYQRAITRLPGDLLRVRAAAALIALGQPDDAARMLVSLEGSAALLAARRLEAADASGGKTP